MRFLLISILVTFALAGPAQDTVDTSPSVDTLAIDLLEHSPLKATILSASLPGAGQIYNKKYWKAPIVWAGLGACIYAIDYNTSTFKEYKSDYLAAIEYGEALALNQPSEANNALIANNNALISFYDEEIDRFARFRDISWMSLGIVYILNILDANVDAHLFYFDVNEDLSLNILPYAKSSAGPTAGLSLRLNF